MSASERKAAISEATTPEEIGDYWDRHSLADHWDEGHDVTFDVRLRRRHRKAPSHEHPE